MVLSKQFQKIGFTEKESKIYLALLELGEADIGQITKKSGVKRTTVYDILSSLKEKALSAPQQEQRKHFTLQRTRAVWEKAWKKRKKY